jgi:hypothetical protein
MGAVPDMMPSPTLGRGREKSRESILTMKITYPDGSTEILPKAMRVDKQNFHEGMYDFYDECGVLLKQIDMHSQIHWEIVDEPEHSR